MGTPSLAAGEAGRPGLPPSPLPGIRVVRLDEAWEGPLQSFSEANPQYFLEALGEPPAAEAAILDIRDLPPEDFSYTAIFLLERFWQRQGYVTTRLREGVDMGRRTNDLRVMVKPLGGRTMQDYLQRVLRDRPADWTAAA